MNSKIKTFSLFFVLILLGLTSCDEQEYTLGDLSAPSNLQITADIVGKSADLPNGDGSGDVTFNLSSDNSLSYKIDFGDGRAAKLYPASFVKKFNNVGTNHYRISVTAVGVGGSATTDIIEMDVYYAFEVDPQIVTLLTGDSETGKKWIIDNELPGHMGKGPGPGRSDGNAESFTPSWWATGPNGRESKGVYNDVFTFTNTKVFTHETGGEIYGTKSFFAAEFDSSTPGVYGGFADEWILDYPDYTENFDFDGDFNGPEGSAVTYIVFPKFGHVGYFSGTHRMMILEITETTMWLRATMPGTNISAWYVNLKVVE